MSNGRISVLQETTPRPPRDRKLPASAARSVSPAGACLGRPVAAPAAAARPRGAVRRRRSFRRLRRPRSLGPHRPPVRPRAWGCWASPGSRCAAFAWPGREAAIRRLERDSDVPHRPLMAVQDKLAAGDNDPMAAALWQAHRKREADRLAGLRNRPARPGMAILDSWALRLVPVLLLIFAVARPVAGAPIAWLRPSRRLSRRRRRSSPISGSRRRPIPARRRSISTWPTRTSFCACRSAARSRASSTMCAAASRRCS